MKKTVIGLAASSALVLGAGAFGSSAVAAPYPASVNTITAITRSASTTEGKSLYVGTIVVGGNAVVADGTVSVIFGGNKVSAPVTNGVASVRIVAPKVKKTTYKTIKAYFQPTPGSVFRPSNATSTLLVKNKG